MIAVFLHNVPSWRRASSPRRRHNENATRLDVGLGDCGSWLAVTGVLGDGSENDGGVAVKPGDNIKMTDAALLRLYPHPVINAYMRKILYTLHSEHGDYLYITAGATGQYEYGRRDDFELAERVCDLS